MSCSASKLSSTDSREVGGDSVDSPCNYAFSKLSKLRKEGNGAEVSLVVFRNGFDYLRLEIVVVSAKVIDAFEHDWAVLGKLPQRF